MPLRFSSNAAEGAFQLHYGALPVTISLITLYMVRAFFGNMWHVINRCCCCMQSTTQGKNTSNNIINLYATLQRNSWHVSLHVLQSATLMPVPNMPGKLVLHAQLHTSRHAQVHHHCQHRSRHPAAPQWLRRTIHWIQQQHTLRHQ